ncbi:transposase [Dyadobacter sp. CY312]|nr:transposase [Dyadobacter sp. CY312]
MNFIITQAKADDRQPLKNEKFIEVVNGKLYAEKGYISQQLSQLLFVDGIQLITGIRNKMKTGSPGDCLMELRDKILLRKRSVIETVNDELKNMCQVEHSRHRSFANFITNLISGLIAYCFLPKKPAIKFETTITNHITLF